MNSATDVEAQILRVDREREEALSRNDVEALRRLYSDDFMMITSTGEIRTREDQLRDISSGILQHPPTSTRILKLRAYGNIAVIQSESQGEIIMDGRADAAHRRYTRVYVNTNGLWQLVATHVSKLERQS